MRYLIALFVFLSLPAFAAGARYFSALPDLPLPPALTEDAGSAVRFDQPEGRVIVLQATGSQQPVEINEFYQRTLPALGWKSEGDNRFTRGEETLTLDIKPLDTTHNRLNILVKPR